VTLSIIIVNYRAWKLLAQALTQLSQQFPDGWEVIVVDNESQPTDFEEFAAQFTWVNFIANPLNSGFGAGCRIGVEAATGKMLLFMNPDVLANVSDIQSLLDEKQRHRSVSILSCRQVGLDGRPQKVFDEFPGVLNQSKILKRLRRWFSSNPQPDPHGIYTELVFCDWLTGSFLLMSRADYDVVGGWSEDYWMYAEDADLCRRARNLNLRAAYTPAVEVVHAHGGSSRINPAIKSMTKLEVIISKHVYVSKHLSGAKAKLAHWLIALLRLPGLTVAAIVDLLTLRRIAALSVRRKMLAGLMRYYFDVRRTGSWLSPRAKELQRIA